MSAVLHYTGAEEQAEPDPEGGAERGNQCRFESNHPAKLTAGHADGPNQAELTGARSRSRRWRRWSGGDWTVTLQPFGHNFTTIDLHPAQTITMPDGPGIQHEYGDITSCAPALFP